MKKSIPKRRRRKRQESKSLEKFQLHESSLVACCIVASTECRSTEVSKAYFLYDLGQMTGEPESVLHTSRFMAKGAEVTCYVLACSNQVALSPVLENCFCWSDARKQ